MKLIDILNMIAKGELEEGTEIKNGEYIFRYENREFVTESYGEDVPVCFWVTDLDKKMKIIGKDTGRIKEINVEQFAEYNDADRSRMLFDKLNEVIRELNRRGE